MTDDEIKELVRRCYVELPRCSVKDHDCMFMVKSPGGKETGHYCIACRGAPEYPKSEFPPTDL